MTDFENETNSNQNLYPLLEFQFKLRIRFGGEVQNICPDRRHIPVCWIYGIYGIAPRGPDLNTISVFNPSLQVTLAHWIEAKSSSTNITIGPGRTGRVLRQVENKAEP